MQEGYSFYWPATQLPYFKNPDGKKVVLRVEHNVPYLHEWKNSAEAEAAAAADLVEQKGKTKGYLVYSGMKSRQIPS